MFFGTHDKDGAIDVTLMVGDALVPNRHQALCNHYADSTVTTVSQILYYTTNKPMGFFVTGQSPHSDNTMCFQTKSICD